MASSLNLSRQIIAELREYPSRCVALETDGECVVCWKAPAAEAQAISGPDVTVCVGLEYVEWDNLDPIIRGPGDSVSLVCRTEKYIHCGLADVTNKQLMEDLAQQTNLKIFILDDRLNPAGKIKHVDWDEEKRSEARELLDRFLKHLESDRLRYTDFVRPNPALQARYHLG